ncbi:MAG: VWA domain-containing protein [Bauldia sp.]|uniref:vWA domain-containing protein n=1 Tax=Bauldia sp. TaxID=2575872 RepID=UPI001DAA03C6|nr:VWA domain-containing protein [Bauldia sp.]MCB1496622.1 VWA domain-containing protein [Bauldia sp.]
MTTGRLAGNIVHFARALRRAGLPVGPAAVVDAIRAVEIAGFTSRDDFYWTLHAIFVSRHDHHPIFDQAFWLFWRTRWPHHEGSPAGGGDEDRKDASPPAARRIAEAMLGGMDKTGAEKRTEVEIDARLTVSEMEALRRRDFAQMDAAEIVRAERQIEDLRLPEDSVASRRAMAAASGTIDPRRTLRSSLRSGGDMILLRHRQSRPVHPPIVVLCDISGSMSPYTRVLLHFTHVLGRQRRVSAFLFGTRLTNVTRQLRHRDVDEALAACSDSVADWSGGTRIASTLEDFNRHWSRRVLGQGAIVLLVTDGLERDGVEDLSRQMDRLHRSCRRLIWLNPLLGFEGFEAKARGIRAMLPHVDELRSVHSLEAVEDICRALSGGSTPVADPRTWLRAA